MNNKKWYKRWWAITFFIFLGLIIIILSFSVSYFLKKVKTYQGEQNKFSGDVTAQIVRQLKNQKQYFHPKGINATNYYLGTTSPEVTIVQFADFSCPYSQKAYSTIRKLGLKYSDHVKIVFRNFPGNKKAINLSMAANCAGEQGFFWSMYDKLFSNQGKIEPNNINQLTGLARQVGADTKKFQQCLKQKKYLPEIKKDIKDGKKMEIKGTPTYFINGYKISGNVPYNLFRAVITGMTRK